MNQPARFIADLSVKFLCACLLACVAAGCGENAPPKSADASSHVPMMGGTPFIRPGMRKPPLESAEAAQVEAGEKVIGISVGDVHRAYVCTAMSTYDTKVINDLIDGVPVTVTYCDRTNCARAFTAKDRSEPLNVSLGGWSGKVLMLQIDGRMHDQDSDDIPLAQVAVERSTWGEWKELHPDGEVFTGHAGPVPESKRAE